MNATHFQAVEQLLKPYGKDVHLFDAVKRDAQGNAVPLTYPYVLLWGSPGLLKADEMDGVQDDVDALLGVTTVTAAADGILVAVSRVRSFLLGKTPLVEGRHVQPLRLYDSQAVQIDRDVTLPASNRHPAFAVDLYRLISEPA